MEGGSEAEEGSEVDKCERGISATMGDEEGRGTGQGLGARDRVSGHGRVR